MAEVLLPPVKDPIDQVLKGLQVAGTAFGIYTDYRKLEEMAAQNKQKAEEAERVRKGQISKERATELLSSGKLETAPAGTMGAIELQVDTGNPARPSEPLILIPRKEKDKPLQPKKYHITNTDKEVIAVNESDPTDRVSIGAAPRKGTAGDGGAAPGKWTKQPYVDDSGNTRMGWANSATREVLMDPASDPIMKLPAGKPVGVSGTGGAGGTGGLGAAGQVTDPAQIRGGEEKKRFDGIAMGYKSVGMMEDALNSGDKTWNVVGDNRFTFARSLWEDAVGRLQSGGAINDEEAKRFRSWAPTPFDSEDMVRWKMDQMRKEMVQRGRTMGVDEDTLKKHTGASAAARQKVDTPVPGVIPAAPKQMTAEDQQAVSWAKANPNHPLAAQILKVNGGGL